MIKVESGEWRVESGEGKGLRCARLILASVMGLLLAGSAALAEGGERLAGHHWEGTEYIGEIRLQIGLMAIISCMMLAGYYLRRVLKNRNER